MSDFKELEKKLLSYCGDSVCEVFEEDLLTDEESQEFYWNNR